jgi:hypothetical protein
MKKPEEKDQSRQTNRGPQAPKKRLDRSRHMAWGIDDVEHHAPKEADGTRRLKSYKTWTDEGT